MIDLFISVYLSIDLYCYDHVILTITLPYLDNSIIWIFFLNLGLSMASETVIHIQKREGREEKRRIEKDEKIKNRGTGLDEWEI